MTAAPISRASQTASSNEAKALSGARNAQLSLQAVWPYVQKYAAQYGADPKVLAGIIDQLHANLGITVLYESLDFADFFSRLAGADGPRSWALGWVADYPSPYDFLGILLGGGQPNNYGGWTSAAFDEAIARAVGSQDPSTVRAAYDQAEAIVRDEVPVVPVAYNTSYALSRAGLLGAQVNGLGILRIAGMAWAAGTP